VPPENGIGRFIGSYTMSVSRSGLITIPHAFRKRLHLDRDDYLIVAQFMDQALAVVEQDGWDQLVRSLEQTDDSRGPLPRSNRRFFYRMLFGTSLLASVDSQGRIRIPKSQLAWANIKKTAQVVGVGNYFEIWDPERYDSYLKLSSDELKKMANRFVEVAAKAARKRVFICHSSLDKDFVFKLSKDLVESGLEVWLDSWEMLPGDSLYHRIADGIENASWFIVVLSDHSVASKWCQKELELALHREFKDGDVFVIPVLISDCELPPFLKAKLYADMRPESYDSGLESLLKRFKS